MTVIIISIVILSHTLVRPIAKVSSTALPTSEAAARSSLWNASDRSCLFKDDAFKHVFTGEVDLETSTNSNSSTKRSAPCRFKHWRYSTLTSRKFM